MTGGLHQVPPTSTRARAEKGASGGGLTIVVQPAASAAPTLRVIMAEGKFHGVMIDLDIGSIYEQEA